MTRSGSRPVPLAEVLQDYLKHRAAAFLDARRSLGLSDVDARALLFIADHPGARPSELMAYLGLTSAGVTTLTERLIRRDAIRRDADSDDRRVIRLTALIDLSSPPWSRLRDFDAAMAHAADRADAAQTRALADLLGRLVDDAAGSHPAEG